MEINTCEQAKFGTLQISGVFARLKSGHISIAHANKMVSDICIRIDAFVDKSEAENKT